MLCKWCDRRIARVRQEVPGEPEWGPWYHQYSGEPECVLVLMAEPKEGSDE